MNYYGKNAISEEYRQEAPCHVAQGASGGTAIQQNIRQSKEEQFQEGFLRELFVKVLGYTLNPSPGYNLITEQKNETNAKKADGAILLDGKVIGVIELKDHKTTDLSKIEAQAFGYKSQHVGTRLVIISNFEKLRLYIDNAVDHREWNLFTLTEEDFRELYLCLAWGQVQKATAIRLKEESVSSEDQITKALYKDYSEFKRVLYADIVSQNPGYDRLLLFKKTQKLLDRLLFIFFAEDCGLLPPNSMMQIIEQWEALAEMDAYVPFYDRVKKYFGYMNTGYQGKKYEIFAYNGGLFKPDEVLDNIKISDELLVENTKRLSTYDFESDVDVNILGHIFENSLSEMEEVTQQIQSGNTAAVGKRKQDGVFYTPQYITKYIVENTVGRLCAEKKQQLGIDEAAFTAAIDGTQVSHLRQPQAERMGTQVSHLRQPQAERMGTQVSHLRQPQAERLRTKKRLLEQLQQYRQWLLQITILDPACGSGAFLNAALQFLMAEHHLIDEMEAKVTGSAIVFQDVENSILEHNLYGVDINEESVEIAQLSLWLRTAKPHRKLNSLNRNIKCGNSLISDPAIVGEKAFDWQKEFPQVFGTQVSHLRNNEQQTADDSPRYASVPLAKTVGNTLAKTAGATPAYHCRKYLPHIENQPLQFITFRLYDSLPKEVIETLKAYRDLLSGTQVSHLRPSVSAGETPAYQYQKMLELLDRYEDAGYGQCFLRDKRIATIVRNTLFYFDGERYELIQWCIMPNHVHVLIKVRPGVSLSTILHSWRTFTAHEANKILGRTGQFWMHEYFDRYIRDARHFESTVNYIRNNPVKAGLVSEPEQWPWVGDSTQVSHLRNAGQQTADDSTRYASVPLATPAGETLVTPAGETLVTPAGETPAYQTPAGETPAYQGGFDVVIGNPPYVQLQSMGAMSDVYARCGFETYNKSADLYCLFYEKGCRLLKDNGILGFIASNKWLRINYGEPLRRYLVSKMNPLLLIDFPGVPVFEDATVDPQILIVGKQKYSGCTQACAIKKHQESLSEYIPRHSITTSFSSEPWTIRDIRVSEVLKKIDSCGKALKALPITINYGIKTGYNDAFFIDGATKDRLVAEDHFGVLHNQFLDDEQIFNLCHIYRENVIIFILFDFIF